VDRETSERKDGRKISLAEKRAFPDFPASPISACDSLLNLSFIILPLLPHYGIESSFCTGHHDNFF
jgi:hypothetical protein